MKSLKVLIVLTSLITLIFTNAAFAQLAERLNIKKERSITKQVDAPVQRVMQFDKRGVWVDDVSLAPEIASTNNYAFSTTTSGSLVNMATGTSTLVVANIDDTGASGVTNIGFDFWFQGVRFTQFSANANGDVQLGSGTIQTGSPYQALAQSGLNIISPYSADQRTHAVDGKVHFKVIGAAPSRTLVIEFLNMQSDFNSGGTADLTYQVQLSETTGVITFVYGSMTLSTAAAADGNSNDPQIGFSSGLAAGTVGSVTAAQSGTPAPTYNGASAVPTNNLYVAGTIPALTSGADGARRTFSFASPVPADPTGLNFTTVTATSYTLNWTDVASNEAGYVIYKSTDGINYTFLTQTAENATSQAVSGLTPSTNYFWRVQAVSEGALSNFLAGSQLSGPAGNDTCAGGGGNWNTGATWADTTVPTSGDNVTIQSGCTVTIDVTTATALNVTVQSGGTLQYITTPASTLTVGNDLTIDAGGSFTAGAGALTTHVLNIGGNSTASGATGNLTVNGTFDMNVGTAGVTTNFFGTQNATLSGAGATADFFTLVGQKGTNNTATLDITRPITIQNGTGAAAAGLHLSVTGGTVKVSSATTATPWFGSQTLVGANGKLWINNAGASLSCVGAGTSATGAGSPTVTGTLQITSGTFAYGQGNNAMSTSGTLIMDGAGATLNMFGSFTMAANSTLTMSAGNINIDPQNVTALAAANNIFRFSGPNTVNFSGGTVTIVDPHAATGAGRAVSFSTSAGTYNMAGGTVRFGNGVSTTAGSVDGFDIDNFVGNLLVPFGNVIIDNTSTNAATRFVRSNLALSPFETDVLGTMTITATGGSRYNCNGTLLAVGGGVVNDGTFDCTTAASSLYFFNNGAPGSFSGGGAITTPMAGISVDNINGVVLDPGLTPFTTLRVNLFDGTITNSNKITIGNGAATTGIVQTGFTGSTLASGNFDVAPTWNLGTGGQQYFVAQQLGSRTTGLEINPTRVLSLLQVVTTNNMTIAGGNLTVTGALTLTDGIVSTGAFTLFHNGAATRTNGYVDGTLGRSYTATGTYTYFVGQGGFTPVLANVTTLTTNPSILTARSFDATLAGFGAGQSISRNWQLEETGDLTADLSFTYLVGDVNGTEANYRVWRRTDAGVTTDMCGAPCVNTTTHVAGPAVGVTSFSRWTAAEALVPTAANANIGGRVMSANGMPIANVKMVLTGGGLTHPVEVYTGTLGYYSFEGLPVGQNYVVTVKSRRFTFTNPSHVHNLQDNIIDGDFTADPQD